jgi:hypothetical protein
MIDIQIMFFYSPFWFIRERVNGIISIIQYIYTTISDQNKIMIQEKNELKTPRAT